MKTEMNIFELLHEKYTLPKTVRLFETFAGIGCQRMAFNRLGIEVDMVGISEIDKYAIKSYMAIHGETKNWGSICDVRGKDLPQIDVFTYSFPCTDLSKAGKQKGLSQTRSGLVYEVLRILHEMTDLPKVLIMENVVDLVQSKFIRQFNEIQAELESLGYTNYAETMNAKDFGVAQNRDRIFMVSVLGGKYYEFPKPFTLTKRLKDYLETNVEEKYYLTNTSLKGLTNALERHGNNLNDIVDNESELSVIQYPRGENGGGLISDKTSPTIDGAIGARNTALLCVKEAHGIVLKNYGKEYVRDIDVTMTLMARDYKGFGNQEMNAVCEPICLNSKVDGKQPSLQDRIYDSEAIATAITTGFMPSVTEPKIEEIVIGSGQKNAFKGSINGVSPTLTSAMGMGGGQTPMVSENNRVRIRKLTPRECWRLMGIDDTYFHKASQVCSNSQLYKQAGNGIVVDVFAEILRTMKGE